MLLELLEQLVDGCLQFGRQRQKQPRASFEELVEPVYRLYRGVHDQYLENFREYQAKLNELGAFAVKTEALCDRLGADNGLPADQETKLIRFMEASRQQQTSYAGDDRLIGFITGICSYLSRAFTEVCGTQYTGGTLRVMSPVFRNSLAGRIRKLRADATLTEEGKQAAAAQILAGIVTELQSGFAAVTSNYLALRTRMAG